MNRCSRSDTEGSVRRASWWLIIPILAVIGGDAEAQSSQEPRWVYGISARVGGLIREDVVPDDPTLALLAEEGREQFRYATYSVGVMRTHSFGIYLGTPLR